MTTERGEPRYGLFDVDGDCWLGDDRGPKIFTDFMLARVAAQVAKDQIGTGSEIIAKEITDNDWHLKDEIAVKRSALESLQRLEGGVLPKRRPGR